MAACGRAPDRGAARLCFVQGSLFRPQILRFGWSGTVARAPAHGAGPARARRRPWAALFRAGAVLR